MTQTSTNDELAARYEEKAFTNQERAKVEHDAIVHGAGFLLDGKALDLAAVRVSSPELAALAGKYLSFGMDDLIAMRSTDEIAFCADVRRLAASVLSQAEGDK